MTEEEKDKKIRIQGNIIRKQQEDLENQRELIEKLQKENEELKEKNKTLELVNTLRSYCKIEELANDFNYYKNLANAYQANSISKDKIREAKKYLEYYLIGNLKYENCQNEFKKILKLLEEE